GRVHQAIERGLQFTLKAQKFVVKVPADEGGWRYLEFRSDDNSDLSVTAWNVASLRSIKNAGFDVPKEFMDQVNRYVLSLYRENTQSFTYRHHQNTPTPQVGMTAAGILCLALAGLHQHPYSIAAAQT